MRFEILSSPQRIRGLISHVSSTFCMISTTIWRNLTYWEAPEFIRRIMLESNLSRWTQLFTPNIDHFIRCLDTIGCRIISNIGLSSEWYDKNVELFFTPLLLTKWLILNTTTLYFARSLWSIWRKMIINKRISLKNNIY